MADLINSAALWSIKLARFCQCTFFEEAMHRLAGIDEILVPILVLVLRTEDAAVLAGIERLDDPLRRRLYRIQV